MRRALMAQSSEYIYLTQELFELDAAPQYIDVGLYNNGRPIAKSDFSILSYDVPSLEVSTDGNIKARIPANTDKNNGRSFFITIQYKGQVFQCTINQSKDTVKDTHVSYEVDTDTIDNMYVSEAPDGQVKTIFGDKYECTVKMYCECTADVVEYTTYYFYSGDNTITEETNRFSDVQFVSPAPYIPNSGSAVGYQTNFTYGGKTYSKGCYADFYGRIYPTDLFLSKRGLNIYVSSNGTLRSFNDDQIQFSVTFQYNRFVTVTAKYDSSLDTIKIITQKT